MLKKGLLIDTEGFFIRDVILTEETNIESNIILIECNESYFRPRWNGTEWIEGATEEEIKLITDKVNNRTDPVKSLAKQVGLLTLENKKKDVQIESLMKAVSTLMNK